MNTGIQDAWNLVWKMALVMRGSSELGSEAGAGRLPPPSLLPARARSFRDFDSNLSAGDSAPGFIPELVAAPACEHVPPPGRARGLALDRDSREKNSPPPHSAVPRRSSQ